MAIIKCKMCGGDLNITEGLSVAECEYCGSKQTIPNVDDEKKLVLFERADRLRRNCEFDKAAGVYESIVADFRTEAEAYWGLVLCKYGIEYVDDPATGRKVPTCHRTSFDSVMDDANFEQALENTDAVARRVYRDEAKAIEELRKGIINVSSTEDPYDIFINYKETDDNGDRTLDSVIAQDIYNALCDKGYRVFFSRITLADKLGTEYEPYIFAALNSAKVMISVGTDYEHFNAVWVKNEWSRFLQLIEKGEKKTLIPCFKNIDAYDMPKEFAKLSAQDMGKVGAMQDLLHGVEKIIPLKSVVNRVTEMYSNLSTAPLEKRVYSLLAEADWKKVDICCEQLLNLDPENPHAYIGKLMTSLKLKAFEDLQNCAQPFDQNENYKKAVEYADENISTQLQDYVEHIKTRNELERKRKEVAARKTARKVKKICAIVIPTVIACVSIALLLTKVLIPNANYSKAEKLYAAGDYEAASEIYMALGDYKDSCSHYIASKYAFAESLMEAGEYEGAIKAYLRVDSLTFHLTNKGIYSDALEKSTEAEYLWAKKLFADGNLDAAEAKFKNLGEYKDSVSYIADIKILRLNSAEVGDIVEYGHRSKSSEINWIVLERKDNKMLLISEKPLYTAPFDNDPYNTHNFNPVLTNEWRWCSLREELQRKSGSDNYSAYFSDTEAAKIIDTYLQTADNPKYGTKGSADTVDKLFLLSIEEAEKYFGSDADRAAKPYIAYNGNYAKWWLRSPGSGTLTAAYVDEKGQIKLQGFKVDGDDIAVRPAMWIDLNA